MRINKTFLLCIGITVVFSSDAFALNAGQEMGQSVQRLANLLHGNVMHAIMVVGVAASSAMSFFKSSFVPVGVGVGTGVLYGFAHTWIDTAFTLCV
jgi:type IV secretory pathway VirB2 component (pilin)